LKEVIWVETGNSGKAADGVKNVSPAYGRLKKYGRVMMIASSFVLSAFCASLSSIDSVGLLAFFMLSLASAFCAFGFFATMSPIVLFSAPPAYIVSVFLTLDPIASLSSVMYIAPAFALAMSVRAKRTRCETVISVSASAVLMFCAVSLVNILFSRGSVSPDILNGYADELLSPVRGILENASLYDKNGEVMYLYTSEQVGAVIGTAKLMMPSVIICAANIFAYISTALFHLFMRRFSITAMLGEDKKWRLSLSSVSAVIFIVSYFMSVLFRTPSATPLTAVTMNLLIILIPGFALVGTKDMIFRIRQREEVNVTPFYIAALIILVCINPSACIMMLSFFGVIVTLMTRFGIMHDGM